MTNYESRIVWRIYSTEQRIFMNCYKSRIRAVYRQHYTCCYEDVAFICIWTYWHNM